MTDITSTGFPPIFVNAYVVAQLEQFGLLDTKRGMSPILPTSPTNIEDVYREHIDNAGVDDPVLIQYERLMRFRTTPFYRNKKEQLIYYIYCTSLSKSFDVTRVISEALDREDAAGQDVNLWLSTNEILDPNSGSAIAPNVFFHGFRTYQTDETRDLLGTVSAKTVYVNKIIVEYDYHTTGTYYTWSKRLLYLIWGNTPKT